MAIGFKKREVSADRVVAVESATAGVPIIGDVRLPVPDPAPVSVPERSAPETSKLGSSQDRHPAGLHYPVGSVHDVPVELVKSNPFNPRAVYTSTAVDAMAESLKTTGQRISATAYVDDRPIFPYIFFNSPEFFSQLTFFRKGHLRFIHITYLFNPLN